jgi:hypothetical protein
MGAMSGVDARRAGGKHAPGTSAADDDRARPRSRRARIGLGPPSCVRSGERGTRQAPARLARSAALLVAPLVRPPAAIPLTSARAMAR